VSIGDDVVAAISHDALIDLALDLCNQDKPRRARPG
jgi:hypothetical protein